MTTSQLPRDNIRELMAWAAGGLAASQGRSRAPYHCEILRSLWLGGPVGGPQHEHDLAISAAFSKGYQDQCDSDAAKIIA